MIPDGSRHLIDTIALGGKLYSLYVIPDKNFESYFVNIVVGPYDAPTPSVVGSVVLTDIDKRGTPEAAIAKVVNGMNAALTAYFGAQPIPVTWEEKFEALLQKLAFFLSGDIPQVK